MLQQTAPVRVIRSVIAVMAALILCCCGAPEAAAPTALPTTSPIPPTPTLTPIPLVETIPLDLAQRQVLATFQRWSAGEQIGIDCILEQCNQYIKLQATIMVPELVEDLARLKIAELQQAGQRPTVPELEAIVRDTSQKLKLDDHVAFMLVAKPEGRRLPLNIGQTIPLHDQVFLRSESGKSFKAAELDPALDHISEEPGTDSKGYILFKRKGEDGADIFDMQKDRQVSIVLQLPPETKINRQELVWVFDLLESSRPLPLAPTPTPVPNVLTSITKDEWLELAHGTIDVLREGVLRIPRLP
jgi:hypothetical protein